MVPDPAAEFVGGTLRQLPVAIGHDDHGRPHGGNVGPGKPGRHAHAQDARLLFDFMNAGEHLVHRRMRGHLTGRAPEHGHLVNGRYGPDLATDGANDHVRGFPAALGHVRKGGTVMCAGIHMSDIPSFPYELLWGERSVRSVANLTRADGEEFLALAAELPLDVEVETFALEQANDALARLRSGAVRGAAVLVP